MELSHEEKGYSIGVVEQSNGRYAVMCLDSKGEIVKRHWVGTREEAEVDCELLKNNLRNTILANENN